MYCMIHTYDTLLERDASEEFDRLHPDLSVERSFRGDQILIEALPGSSTRLASVFIYSTRVEEGGKWLPAISLLVRPQESPESRRQDITIPCHDPSRYIVDGYMCPETPALTLLTFIIHPSMYRVQYVGRSEICINYEVVAGQGKLCTREIGHRGREYRSCRRAHPRRLPEVRT